MIRYVFCARRDAAVSVDEFRRLWSSETFVDLVGRVGLLLKAERITRSVTLQLKINERLARERGSGEQFDGMIEYCWSQVGQLESIYDSPTGEILKQEMTGFQQQFIDFSRSTACFVEELDQGR